MMQNEGRLSIIRRQRLPVIEQYLLRAASLRSTTVPLVSVVTSTRKVHLPSSIQPLIAAVARWSYCEPDVLPPDVGFVEPLLRRRLSSLAKMSLGVAYSCAHDVPDLRIVYASRHGELARTTMMLESLASGEDLSPTQFSMSVLNASAGLFSILRKNTAPATAISAGCASFGYGLLEACLQQLENPGQSVLYVYADEPVPDVYGTTELPGSNAHAVGLLLTPKAETRIACAIAAHDDGASDEAQSRAFLRCLDAGQATWSEAGKRWSWMLCS